MTRVLTTSVVFTATPAVPQTPHATCPPYAPVAAAATWHATTLCTFRHAQSAQQHQQVPLSHFKVQASHCYTNVVTFNIIKHHTLHISHLSLRSVYQRHVLIGAKVVRVVHHGRVVGGPHVPAGTHAHMLQLAMWCCTCKAWHTGAKWDCCSLTCAMLRGQQYRVYARSTYNTLPRHPSRQLHTDTYWQPLLQ